jgi:hypothetical protein
VRGRWNYVWALLDRGGHISPVEALGVVFEDADETLALLGQAIGVEVSYKPSGKYLLNTPIAFYASVPFWKRLDVYFAMQLQERNLSSCIVDALTDRFFPDVTDDDVELRGRAFALSTELVRERRAHPNKVPWRALVDIIEAAVNLQAPIPGKNTFVDTSVYTVFSKQAVAASSFIEVLDEGSCIDWTAPAFGRT